MNILQNLASQTPVRVWLLLAFLITRGIAAMKPAETSLQKLAIVPALFAVGVRGRSVIASTRRWPPGASGWSASQRARRLPGCC
ncbi:hypothetical protein Q7W57_05500 [Stenotrophomonas geniculata]|nr:hypothetical protein [Stenotrophomonas geniculata]MDP4307846.1 hypothetical protein [Stenotrophomonas geniculata]